MPDWAEGLLVILVLAAAGTVLALRPGQGSAVRGEKGRLSLVELLSVVAMIGVIAWIAVPRFLRTPALVEADNVLAARQRQENVAAYRLAYPTDWDRQRDAYYECVVITQEGGSSFQDAKIACAKKDLIAPPSR